MHVCVCACAFQSLETLDNGKPFKDALDDVQNGIDIARYFAGLADKVVGQTIPAGLAFKLSLTLLLVSLQCFMAQLGMLNKYRLTDYLNGNRSANLRIDNGYSKCLMSRPHCQHNLFNLIC